MSHEQPEPPLGADSPEKLVAQVANNPSAWLLYLRHMNDYAATLQKKVDFLRTKISDRNAIIQLLQLIIAKQEKIVDYQEIQHRKNIILFQKRITKFEIEKLRLLDAATPVVQTPRSAPVDVPSPPVEQPAHPAPRPNTLAPSVYSERSHLNKKIPDPKEFDNSQSDLRRFTQQIYDK
jgi:hypothetical protein